MNSQLSYHYMGSNILLSQTLEQSSQSNSIIPTYKTQSILSITMYFFSRSVHHKCKYKATGDDYRQTAIAPAGPRRNERHAAAAAATTKKAGQSRPSGGAGGAKGHVPLYVYTEMLQLSPRWEWQCAPPPFDDDTERGARGSGYIARRARNSRDALPARDKNTDRPAGVGVWENCGVAAPAMTILPAGGRGVFGGAGSNGVSFDFGRAVEGVELVVVPRWIMRRSRGDVSVEVIGKGVCVRARGHLKFRFYAFDFAAWSNADETRFGKLKIRFCVTYGFFCGHPCLYFCRRMFYCFTGVDEIVDMNLTAFPARSKITFWIYENDIL